MAEGWARTLRGDQIEPHSAGITATGLDPRAVLVMREVGVDISAQRSKTLADLGEASLDLVVTVCDNARATCPVLPGAKRTVHAGFDDPPHLARNAKSEAEALRHYRRVRDEIRAFVEALPVAPGGTG